MVWNACQCLCSFACRLVTRTPRVTYSTDAESSKLIELIKRGAADASEPSIPAITSTPTASPWTATTSGKDETPVEDTIPKAPSSHESPSILYDPLTLLVKD